MNENTQEWREYQSGLRYKSKINLLATADKNEAFYAGYQWRGLNTNKLSLVVLNVVKLIANFKRNIVMSDNLTMQFTADGIADDTTDPDQILWRNMANILSQYSKTTWENLKLDSMNEDGLLDAELSGDMVSYWFWNEKVNAGNGVMGDLDGEKIDNCNYFPGDPNDDRVNDAYGPVQPYIILAFRRQVADVRKEAKENGIQQEEIDLIFADTETQNQFGDRAKMELDPDGEESGKCIVLLKLYPKDGTIWAKKSTRSVVIRNDWDTELHRYPVALFNWEKRKNSAHGEADVTSMIPNQIEINRTASMIARWVRLHGFPKVLFDKSRISSWTNDMSVAVGVNGEITGAANYIQAAQLSGAVMQFMTWFIQITKEMAGANESVLGEAAPTNTSAIIVNSKSATLPLNSPKRRFHQYIEDVGLIWLDMWLTKYAAYPERLLTIKPDNKTTIVSFDAKKLHGVRLKLKIDVGPSTQWNEAAAAQTLDNLLQRRLITFIEYLKRLPNGVIPDRQGLIDDRESAEAAQQLQQKQLLYQLMARFMDEIEPTLSPEALNELKMMQRNDPVGYEKQVIQLIQQSEQQARPYANNVEGSGTGGMSTMQTGVNGKQQ